MRHRKNSNSALSEADMLLENVKPVTRLPACNWTERMHLAVSAFPPCSKVGLYDVNPAHAEGSQSSHYSQSIQTVQRKGLGPPQLAG